MPFVVLRQGLVQLSPSTAGGGSDSSIAKVFKRIFAAYCGRFSFIRPAGRACILAPTPGVRLPGVLTPELGACGYVAWIDTSCKHTVRTNTTTTRAREGEVFELCVAPRGQNTLHPGKRREPLEEVSEPEGSGGTRGSLRAGARPRGAADGGTVGGSL